MWLRGYSRDETAKEAGIGAGTVSSIIQQCRQDDPDFDLLRAVALELRNQGMQVKDFAPLFRLKQIVEEKEVQLEIPQNNNLFAEFKKFEALIVALEVSCFKHGTSLNQFFERVKELYDFCDRQGTSVKNSLDHIIQFGNDIESQKKKLASLRLETKKQVERHGATMDQLREYQARKPLYEARKRELERVTKDRDLCQDELNKIIQKHDRKVLDNTRGE